MKTPRVITHDNRHGLARNGMNGPSRKIEGGETTQRRGKAWNAMRVSLAVGRNIYRILEAREMAV